VAHPSEKTTAPVSQLPKPELNPMINPTLGRNLGRWAQVYFTSPPEKREAAVGELLRELESESSEEPSPEPTPEPKIRRPGPEGPSRKSQQKEAAQYFSKWWESSSPDESELDDFLAQISSPPVETPKEFICGSCSYVNSTGQKYCGHCGSPLLANGHDIDVARPRQDNIEHTVLSQTPARPSDDTQWLRERALTSFEQCEAPASRGWKYLVLIFLILAAGFAYMRWAQSRPLPEATANVPSLPETSASQPNAPNPPPAPSKSPRSARAQEKPGIEQNVKERPVKQNPVPAALRSKENDTKSLEMPSTAATTPPASSQDVLLAQQYLQSRSGTRNPSQAAPLLWRAVGKQNSDAAVLLSDLYARGDGVPKNCDQARLLLLAAAKRGSSRAAEQLRVFDLHSCR
jgi:hypothetical protein